MVLLDIANKTIAELKQQLGGKIMPFKVDEAENTINYEEKNMLIDELRYQIEGMKM